MPTQLYTPQGITKSDELEAFLQGLTNGLQGHVDNANRQKQADIETQRNWDLFMKQHNVNRADQQADTANQWAHDATVADKAFGQQKELVGIQHDNTQSDLKYQYDLKSKADMEQLKIDNPQLYNQIVPGRTSDERAAIEKHWQNLGKAPFDQTQINKRDLGNGSSLIQTPDGKGGYTSVIVQNREKPGYNVTDANGMPGYSVVTTTDTSGNANYQFVPTPTPKPVTVAAPIADWTKHITSNYGQRGKDFHGGLDIATPNGTPAQSMVTGTVIDTGDSKTMGRYVKVRDANGFVITYMHASNIAVSRGESVLAGQTIMQTGNTGRVRGENGGYHLHVQVNRPDGGTMNPVNYFQLVSKQPNNSGQNFKPSSMVNWNGNSYTAPQGKVYIVNPNAKANDFPYSLVDGGDKNAPKPPVSEGTYTSVMNSLKNDAEAAQKAGNSLMTLSKGTVLGINKMLGYKAYDENEDNRLNMAQLNELRDSLVTAQRGSAPASITGSGAITIRKNTKVHNR